MQINQAFESFQIKGYRGIENMELTELGQVNIFVGNNNSGKTSILEAISILCDPLNLFQWLNISKRRSRGNGLYLRSDEIESIKWMFPQKNDFSDEQSYQGEISLAATDNFGKPKMIAKLSEISGTTIDDDEISSELDQEYPDDYIRSGVELEVIFTPSSSQLSLLPETDQRVVFPLWGKKEFTIKEKGKPFIENTTVSPSYNYSAEQISRKYERIFSHRKDEIVEILKEFDDKVLDVRIAAKNKINIYHQDYHQDTGLVPLPLLLAHTKSAPYPQILLAKQIGLL